jgi:hypothetical protein
LDIDPQSRLANALSVVEHEMQALEDLRDDRLIDVVQTMSRLRAEIVAALPSFLPTAHRERCAEQSHDRPRQS